MLKSTLARIAPILLFAILFGCGGGGGGGGRAPAGSVVGRAMIQMSLVLTPETVALITPDVLKNLKAQGMDVVNGKLVTPRAPLVGRWITIAGIAAMTDVQGYFRFDSVPAGASQGQIFRSLKDGVPEGTFALDKLAAEGTAPQPITIQTTLFGPVEMNEPFRSARAAPAPTRSGVTRDSCILRTACAPGDNSTGCCLDYDGAAGDGRPLLRHDPQTVPCKAKAVVNFIGSTCFNWSFGIAGSIATIGGTDCWNEQAYQEIGNNAPGCWQNHKYRNCQNLDKTDFAVIPGSVVLTPNQSVTIRLRNNTPANETVLSISEPNLPGTLKYGSLAPLPGTPLTQNGPRYLIEHYDDANHKHYEDIELVYTAPASLLTGANCDTLHLTFQAYGQTKTFDIGFNFGPGGGAPIVIHNAAELAAFGSTAIACGPLTITGSDITSLQPLSSLHEVHGPLNINNTGLTSLNGLQTLQKVEGRITISANPAMVNLTGLSGLKETSGLLIESNPKLTSVGGFTNPLTMDILEVNGNTLLTNLDGLTNVVRGELGRGLFILNNPALTSIAGLRQVSMVGLLDVEHNDILADLTGLNGITRVLHTLLGNGDFLLQGKAITSLAGLANLQIIDGPVSVDPADFGALTDYRLVGLRLIGGNLDIKGGPGPMTRVAFPSLDDVSRYVQIFPDNGNGFQSIDFSVLRHVGDYFQVEFSNTPTIDARALAIVDGYIEINHNPEVKDCSLDTLTTVGNYVEVLDNAQLARIHFGTPNVGAYFVFKDNPLLTTITMSSFSTGQYLEINNNDALPNPSFGPGTINTYLAIQKNHGFTNTQAQNFANTLTVKGNKIINGNG